MMGTVTTAFGRPRDNSAVVVLTVAIATAWAIAFWAELDAHPQIIAGTLALAAIYQLTPLKDACLHACRHPGAYLMRHYRRGAIGGWRLGLGHALFCVGCCWALMLVMFAVGVAHLAWMGALALIMFVEKTMPWGGRLVRPIGAMIAVLAFIALLRPGTVPGL